MLAEGPSEPRDFLFGEGERPAGVPRDHHVGEWAGEQLAKDREWRERLRDEDLSPPLHDAVNERLGAPFDRGDGAERARERRDHAIEADQIVLKVAYQVGVDPARVRGADAHSLVAQLDAK